MNGDLSTALRSREVDKAARNLQRLVLKECTSLLRDLRQQFWLFVHLRSIALRRDGRSSIWNQINVPKRREHTAIVEKALRLQYHLEPNHRTYNELLISIDRNGHHESFKRVSFGFGDSAEDVDIQFSHSAIQEATERLSFMDCSTPTGEISQVYKSKLSQLRLSIGLSDQVRRNFHLDNLETSNPLLILPDEVRYALQVLMLWSNTLGWKFIETHHSRTRFDALTGLVVTVCSRDYKLQTRDVEGIRHILQLKEGELDTLAKMKSECVPRNKGKTRLSDTSENRLTLFMPHRDRLWEGRDVFHELDTVRKTLFAATFEGTPESYSFIFGHPGFISRPKELERSRTIDLSRIREHRELCEGALDVLNVVDVLGEPKGNRHPLSVIPITFPTWAKRWDDTEQAFGASLEALSSVHQQMVVAGLMCRNVLMVYRRGELVCVFNGLWQEILPWETVAQNLRIPNVLAQQPRVKEIYRLMTRIAYGPSPRSVIVGYAVGENEFARFQAEVDPSGGTVDDWPEIDQDVAAEHFLMRATKTDGAILTYTNPLGNLVVQSRARVVSRGTRTPGKHSAGGTGDATAGAMARKGSGLMSMKISRDGGMKVRWDGGGPLRVAVPMELD